MRLSSLFVTFGLALLVLGVPLEDDNTNASVVATHSIQARTDKTGAGSGKSGKGSGSHKNKNTPTTSSSHHTATTTTTSSKATGTSTSTSKGTGSSSKGDATEKTCPVLSTLVGSGGSSSKGSGSGSGSSHSSSKDSGSGSKHTSKGKGGSKSGTSTSKAGSDLSKRAGLVHPPGKSDTTLFHGTDSERDAAQLKSDIKLVNMKYGDLHDIEADGVDGALYLTDSLLSAAQFACRKIRPGPKSDDQVYVLEYKWDGADLPVKDFEDTDEYKEFVKYAKESKTNPTFDQILLENYMITGPMNNPNADWALSPSFWQYAVIKQKAIDDKKLTWVATHRVTCSAVPPGEKLIDQIYAAGQKSNPAFPQMETAMTDCIGPYDWDQAVNDAMNEENDG